MEPSVRIQRYKKAPVVIEAVCYDGTKECADVIRAWSGDIAWPAAGTSYIAVRTPHGHVFAEKGDYVVKDVAGGFYPCSKAVFMASHEPVQG